MNFLYILKNNLSPLIERILKTTSATPKFVSTLFAHSLKRIEGKYEKLPEFSYVKVLELLEFLTARKLDLAIAKRMLEELYQYPKMDPESILVSIGFKEIPQAEIEGKLPFLIKKYQQIRISKDDNAGKRWIMGNLSKIALGNVNLSELSEKIVF